MNVAMWVKALQVIPRIDKNEWDQLDVFSKWLIATRSAVFVITFISAALSGILAARNGSFHFGLWLLVTVGLIAAHATNNLINDLTDYLKGVDKDNYFRAQYGPQTLEHGLLTKGQLIKYIAVTGAIAAVIGAYLIWYRGGLTLLLMALGAFFVLFYTFPLKYLGLGELAVLLVWGPLMVGGGYYVITGFWDWNVVLASLPYALGATTVLSGKHIDKYNDDKAKGIRTLPVLLGERPARYMVMGMMILQYALVVYLVVIKAFTPALLLVFLALTVLRPTLKAFSQPRPASPPDDIPEAKEVWPIWFVGYTFLHNRRYGMLYILGLILDAVIVRLFLAG
ncbi:MAG: prenyltransferase [Chloroflexota bacterium]